jgi:hypothetical protein
MPGISLLFTCIHSWIWIVIFLTCFALLMIWVVLNRMSCCMCQWAILWGMFITFLVWRCMCCKQKVFRVYPWWVLRMIPSYFWFLFIRWNRTTVSIWTSLPRFWLFKVLGCCLWLLVCYCPGKSAICALKARISLKAMIAN